MPRVTVLMPVYNGERYLREAVDSILCQTFTDFELLIINDGSTDKTVSIINFYTDPRIRLVHNSENLGLIPTLNKGIDLAQGEYIARMDCDDISLPNRLARQVAFMDQNPDIGVCGCWYRFLGDSEWVVSRPACNADLIRCGLLFNSMVGHPTVILRRSFFARYNLYYDPKYPHAEDFELWVRAAKYFLIDNIPEVLLLYRIHASQVTKYSVMELRQTTRKIRAEGLDSLGIHPTQEELTFHQSLCDSSFTANREFLKNADTWLCRIKAANDKAKLYPEPAFFQTLIERWLVICYKTQQQGFWPIDRFLRPRLLKGNTTGQRYASRLLFLGLTDLLRDRMDMYKRKLKI